MIYHLSDNYYDSVACLNEMGAAWVVQNDYTVVGIPGFDHFIRLSKIDLFSPFYRQV